MEKAIESKQCHHAALWMYRITPLDDHLPSPYELLFGRRPKSMLPSSESSLQSQHPNKDCHQEAIYVNKQSTLLSTTRKQAMTNEPSAATIQSTPGIRSNTSGNPARSSASRILVGNQECIWLKCTARSTSEQGSICVHESPWHPIHLLENASPD